MIINVRRWLWLFCLGVCMLTGCAGSRDRESSDSREQKLQVVTTLFPYYDFTRQIAGDLVDLSLVIPAGMDSHSFEPTPADMQMIQSADILICNGGEMEHWLEEVLEAIDTTGLTVVTMMDYVEAVEEELVEGMEEEEDAHEHSGSEYDEHIFTSPVNAEKLVAAIRDSLTEADRVHGEQYRQQADGYEEKLKKLDADFRQMNAERMRNMIIIGDKFPFRYLAEEYDLEYRAAFSGCSSDTEPSARTIAYLIDKVKEEQIPVVYYLEFGSRRIAEIIAEETGAAPLLLHSCHTVTRSQFDGGITYLDLMEQNLENLRKGLVK